MRSPLPLAAALAACLTLASCANLKPPASVPPPPQPAALATQCPPPPEPADNSADAAMLALKSMYDLYGLCAGRLVELVNWMQENH